MGIAQEYLREKELFDADEKAQAGQNLLSLVSMRGFNASGTFRREDLKENSLWQLYVRVVQAIRKEFPLIGDYLEMVISHDKRDEILENISNLKFDDLSNKDKELFYAK